MIIGWAERLFAFALVCAAVIPVAASEDKTAPGTICRVRDLSDQTEVTYGTNGRVSAQSSVDVICPFITDETGNSNGLDDADVWVHVDSGYINCTLRCVNPTGVEAYADTRATNGTHIDFELVSDDCTANGTYALACELDAGDVIYSVKWEE